MASFFISDLRGGWIPVCSYAGSRRFILRVLLSFRVLRRRVPHSSAWLDGGSRRRGSLSWLACRSVRIVTDDCSLFVSAPYLRYLAFLSAYGRF